MSDVTKRYLISSAITFVAAFLVAIVPEVQSLTPEAVEAGAVFGIIIAAARAGLKAVAEAFVGK